MIIADTGFWLALASRTDEHHPAAVAALERHREPLITTWPVLTETCHLLSTRLGPHAEVAFVDSLIAGAASIAALAQEQLPRIRELMARYAALPMDLADATLVVLAEELGSGRIFTTDRRNFGAYRWKNRKPFRNLLQLGSAR